MFFDERIHQVHEIDFHSFSPFQNGNIENPYCNGIEGILEAYHQSLKTVQLYGPTNFAPVVNHVARWEDKAADEYRTDFLLLLKWQSNKDKKVLYEQRV